MTRTPEQQRLILDRVFAAWQRRPELRLGELLVAALGRTKAPLAHVQEHDLLVALERDGAPGLRRRRVERLVVVESPYAGDVERNVRYARACMVDCLRRGEAPTASHILYAASGCLDDLDPAQRTRGIDAGLAWARRADVSAVYEDLGVSRGMQLGIEHAERCGRPVEWRRLGGEWSGRC